jgi:hypothetical protein
MDKPIGWQIVATETDDPPESMVSYEIYSLEFCLKWLQAESRNRASWRLLPIWEGDVEEPSFPEREQIMIYNLKDLAEHVESVREDAKSIARRLYKDTSCGIGFEEVPGGVEVAGYAEGSDVELPNHRLLYPFTPEEFDAVVKVADEEGSQEWDEANSE